MPNTLNEYSASLCSILLIINDKPVGDMVRSLCKYRSSAHLLKLTGKLVCDVARLISIMIIRDDVISDVIRPRSTIREDHI